MVSCHVLNELKRFRDLSDVLYVPLSYPYLLRVWVSDVVCSIVFCRLALCGRCSECSVEEPLIPYRLKGGRIGVCRIAYCGAVTMS